MDWLIEIWCYNEEGLDHGRTKVITEASKEELLLAISDLIDGAEGYQIERIEISSYNK